MPFSMQMLRNCQNPFTQKASSESRIMLMVLNRVSEVISFLGGYSAWGDDISQQIEVKRY